MADEEKTKSLEDRVNKLEQDYRVAVNTIRIGIGLFVVMLAIFFGITYKQIGNVAQEAIKNSTIDKVITAAKNKVDETSKKANEDINNIEETVKSISEEAVVIIKNKINIAEAEIIKLKNSTKIAATKCDNIFEILDSNKRESEAYLKNIKEIVPNLSPFSISGTAKDGELISPPWGTIKDWNLMISPNEFGFKKEGVERSSSYILLGANFTAEPKEEKGWIVNAKSSHKFGASTNVSPATINYLLTPFGKNEMDLDGTAK